jgi:macrolide transport system ATP-binding/permease protein
MAPQLQLRGAIRVHRCGGGVFTALKGIDLAIVPGEFIAIVGVSGSGKSTLLNILGCLDLPTSGTYHVDGRSTADMTSDALAALRRDHFGFIFQRYNLLPDLTALDNVELPAIYAGQSRLQRRSHAIAILSRLELGDRSAHFPGQLSGGQQQRVGIARALINGGDVILGDEPTGALGSNARDDVLAILEELHTQGNTVIVVTHDPRVARHAERIIELRDGEIASDGKSSLPSRRRSGSAPSSPTRGRAPRARVGLWSRSLDVFQMAFRLMAAHRLRTLLSMLGIIIGIAAVISVVALGNGAEEEILRSIRALGTNTLEIYPGAGIGDPRASRVQTLRATDAVQLSFQPFVDSVTPEVSASATVRYGNIAASALLYGVGSQFFRVKGLKVLEGSTFDTEAVSHMEQSVVIDENARKQLFGATESSATGKVILLGRVPSRVIGVVEGSGSLISAANLRVWVPYTTMMTRMLGQSHVSSIAVRVSDDTPIDLAEQAITRILSLKHGRKDFFIQDSVLIRQTIETTSKTVRLFIESIAAISLLVGGIGVMNIMLVSVTERTREIGIRIAVGARQSDILLQFLVEAALVCLIGGTLGVLTAFSLGALLRHISDGAPMIFSAGSIIAALLCSTLIGITFGFLPARNAARMDPAEALSRE